MQRYIKTAIIVLGAASFVIGAASLKYKVDPVKCISCHACVSTCPTKAIAMVDTKAFIDPEKCIGCGACATVCPTQAIAKDSVVADTTVISE